MSNIKRGNNKHCWLIFYNKILGLLSKNLFDLPLNKLIPKTSLIPTKEFNIHTYVKPPLFTCMCVSKEMNENQWLLYIQNLAENMRGTHNLILKSNKSIKFIQISFMLQLVYMCVCVCVCYKDWKGMQRYVVIFFGNDVYQ